MHSPKMRSRSALVAEGMAMTICSACSDLASAGIWSHVPMTLMPCT